MNPAQSTFLDALRGLAAQLVLIGHIHSTANQGQTWGIGDLGVIVFFILSGFLISYSAQIKQARGGYRLPDFLRDRFFRIFVPYLPALLFVLLLDSYVFTHTNALLYLEHYNLKDFLATLLMLQQHPIGLFSDQMLGLEAFKLATFGSARPWWTVSIEWWLYVSFGLILFAPLFARLSLRYLALLALVSIVPLFNAVAGTGQGLSLIWGFMALLAWAYTHWGEKIEGQARAFRDSGVQARLLLAVLLVTLCVLAIVRVIWISYIETGFVFDRPRFYDFNLYVLLLLFFATIFVLLGSGKESPRRPVVKFVADYSYSLYLIHYSLIHAFHALGYLDGDDWGALIACYVACNLTAMLFYLLFERHYKYLQRLYESRLPHGGRR